ncbi:MAG: hypothetical protein QM744_14490 [Mesorhizobium sp.]
MKEISNSTAMQPEPTVSANPAEIRVALKLLSTLTKREPADPRTLRDAFTIALDGVQSEVLKLATNAILQNSLGHPFMPSPAELRGECDRIAFSHLLEALAANPTPPPDTIIAPPPAKPEPISRPLGSKPGQSFADHLRETARRFRGEEQA